MSDINETPGMCHFVEFEADLLAPISESSREVIDNRRKSLFDVLKEGATPFGEEGWLVEFPNFEF